ncbi:hypothetical protein GpartN1_g298.t1 [Galdieria partita]|uniref:2-phosphoglycerate kinase n=1 Tax=Galdieria partita TaxID=83374 RepID=A0A9C7PR63_9RHOD|nr:hypothetical protein GpartN1_g298.t1 [Galdieria partita]
MSKVVLSVNVWFCKPEQHVCLLNKSNLSLENFDIQHLDNLFRFEHHMNVYWKNDLRKLSRQYGGQCIDSEETQVEQNMLFKEDIERLFCLTGYKPAFAQHLANCFFSSLNHILLTNSTSQEQQYDDTSQTAHIWSCQLALYLAKSAELQGGAVTNETCEDIMVALHLIGHHLPVIILLGGTSGCGKSTLAYMLARKLGINKVISTDTIRACLRTHSSPNDTFYGVLHSSSYEIDSHLPPDFIASETTPRKRLLKAYKLQAELMEPFIHHLIANSLWQKESLVVEGVHLSVKIMKHLVEEFHVVIPFITYISNEAKHVNRFAVRVKYMALNSSGNKYVKNFQHIRQIQEYLCRKADIAGFPKIDNTNTDRSLAAVHALGFSCIKEFWRHYAQIKEDHSPLPGIITRGTEKMIWKSSRMALMDICLHRIEKLSVENGEATRNCQQNKTQNLVVLKGKLKRMISGQKYGTKELIEYLRQICSESEKDDRKGD